LDGEKISKIIWFLEFTQIHYFIFRVKKANTLLLLTLELAWGTLFKYILRMNIH